jgi:hypothetical protein
MSVYWNCFSTDVAWLQVATRKAMCQVRTNITTPELVNCSVDTNFSAAVAYKCVHSIRPSGAPYYGSALVPAAERLSPILPPSHHP